MLLFSLALLITDLDVRDFGATGRKSDDARAAIQKALDACAAAGGGCVRVPAGDYTTGELVLRSHVRLQLEAGATLFASTDMSQFKKGALLYGEDLEQVTIEGGGTLDGQSEYEWRLSDLDDAYLRANELRMKQLGKPLMRPFPKGFPQRTMYPRMMLLIRCKDVRIAQISLVRSPSWNIHPYACERLVIDGVSIASSLKEGVWADGIDPDGCRDVRIANCTIETGDDALVFYSSNAYGPPRPCENITVTNCRLSSASSALKFCDGNLTVIRRVVIDNCIITGANRGIAFMTFDGGDVEDVVISNMVIECERYDWFWWGDCDPIHFNVKRRNEVHAQAPKQDRVGAIRNVRLTNIVARGQGTCAIDGHPERALEDITLDGVTLIVTAEPAHPMQRTRDAMSCRWVNDLTLRDVGVAWAAPGSPDWQSALRVEDVRGLTIDSFRGGPGQLNSEAAAIALARVRDAMIHHARARDGTQAFLSVGVGSSAIGLFDNDLRLAAIPYRLAATVPAETVTARDNWLGR